MYDDRDCRTEKEKEYAAKWETVGISNDLMFRFVMEDSSLCRRTLILLMNKNIGVIEKEQTQFSIETSLKTKGIRLDLYVEADGEMMDVEMQTSNLVKRLMLRRLRFYQSQMDQLGIEKGDPYQALKKSAIIFICTYDPFGKGAGIYTLELACKEYPNLPIDNGATIIIYNTKGKIPENHPNKLALENFFDYVNGGTPKDEFCKDLDEAVKFQKLSTEKKEGFIMWNAYISEHELLAKEQGIELGREQGIELGKEQGITFRAQQTALKMLKLAEPINKIIEYTDLDISKIKELANRNGYLLVYEV